MLQLHRQCKVNGVCKLSVCHSLCIGDATFLKIYSVRFWREFIVNLWVNWNLGCLKVEELFPNPISRLQRASTRLHSLCALFQCVLRLTGIVLRFWTPESAEILRGVCWHVHIDDLRLCFEIVALEYWCLGVSLSNRVFDKLIRAVRVWRRLAQKKRPGGIISKPAQTQLPW